MTLKLVCPDPSEEARKEKDPDFARVPEALGILARAGWKATKIVAFKSWNVVCWGAKKVRDRGNKRREEPSQQQDHS